MSSRNDRHAFLRRLVHDDDVESQTHILQALSGAGMEVHQSTLSRDLRELGIRKVRGRYQAAGASAPGPRLAVADGGAAVAKGAAPVSGPGLRDGATLPEVRGFTACGPNLITVRTATGQAQLLGVLLDTTDDPRIAGTIAGDDTVLVVTKGRPEQRAVQALLTSWFGEDKRDAV